MSLLPSRPDASQSEDAEPRVIGVDSEDADDVLAALSSETARQILNEIHGEPATASELAKSVDTTVQNTQYHLDKLTHAGAIEVVETAYSEKGREMNVYAAADRPLVIFAGDDDGESTLRTALSRLLGPVGLLGVASLAIQSVFGELNVPFVGETDDDEFDDDAAPADEEDAPAPDDDAPVEDEDVAEEPAETPEADSDAADEDAAFDAAAETPSPDEVETPPPELIETTADTAAGLPPGVLFFAGGLFVIGVVGFLQYYRQS